MITQLYLRFIIEILMELPPAGMGILTYYIFKNIEAGLIIFGVCSLLTVMALLYISEFLFSRLESNN